MDIKYSEWLENITAILNAATNLNLTPNQFDDWLEGGADYSIVDEVVKNYLGDELFKKAEYLARLVPVLEAVLNGEKEITIGGIRFSDLQERKTIHKMRNPNQPLIDWVAASLNTYDFASGSALTEKGLFTMMLASLMHFADDRHFDCKHALREARRIYAKEVRYALEYNETHS